MSSMRTESTSKGSDNIVNVSRCRINCSSRSMVGKSVLLLIFYLMIMSDLCAAFQTAPMSPRKFQRYQPGNRLQRNFVPTSSQESTSTSLRLSPSLGAGASPIGAFLVLTGIVVIHEAGHYLAARSFGIKVDEFSVGFGPKLAGFEAFGNEFNFRAIPLGGYVRFPENYNITLVNEQEDALREQRRMEKKNNNSNNKSNNDDPTDKKFDKKTPGYVIANAATFGLLERRRQEREQKERIEREEKEKSTPWWQKTFLKKEKEDSGPPDEIDIDYYDDPDLLQNRPWPQRAVVLSAGVVFNLLLAFSIFFGELATTGLPEPIFQPGAVVSAAPAKDAAANGILQIGDIVVGVNGKPISLSQSPSSFAAQKSVSDFIATIRSTPEGELLKLSILRPNTANAVNIDIQPKLSSSGAQTLGVLLAPNYIKTDLIRAKSPVDAAVLATKYTSDLTYRTADGLISFIGSSISGKETGQQVSGPLGVLRTGSEVVSTQKLSTILGFAAAISINLGVVNAFPVPALDGGQLVFVLAEAVTGRKLDQRVQEDLIGIAVLLLLFVSASAFLGDIKSVVGR